jgi:hypothetical protein
VREARCDPAPSICPVRPPVTSHRAFDPARCRQREQNAAADGELDGVRRDRTSRWHRSANPRPVAGAGAPARRRQHARGGQHRRPRRRRRQASTSDASRMRGRRPSRAPGPPRPSNEQGHRLQCTGEPGGVMHERPAVDARVEQDELLGGEHVLGDSEERPGGGHGDAAITVKGSRCGTTGRGAARTRPRCAGSDPPARPRVGCCAPGPGVFGHDHCRCGAVGSRRRTRRPRR